MTSEQGMISWNDFIAHEYYPIIRIVEIKNKRNEEMLERIKNKPK